MKITRNKSKVNTRYENEIEKSDVKLSTFLRVFFPNANETVYLRAFKPKDSPENNINPREWETTIEKFQTDTQLQKELVNANATRGVYFVVNSGGKRDADISHFNSFFVENDNLSIAEQHRALDDCSLQPSIRVETKKSVHAYWLIDGNCSESDWREIQNGLIQYFNGDNKIKNPSRCMRLPFFNHISFSENKPELKTVEIVAFNPEKRYTVEQMKDVFSWAEIIEVKENPRPVTTVTTSNQLYKDWEELNAELGRKIAEVGRLNAQGKYEMRCPNHNGKTATSLFYDPSRKTIKCMGGCLHKSLLEAFGLPTKPTKDNGEYDDEKQTQVSLLLAFKEEIELFVSDSNEGYATIPSNGHFETWAVSSKEFEGWIAKRYYQTYNRAPRIQAIEEAVANLIGEARFGNYSQKKVFTRIAESNDAIYLDLVNENWEVIKITPGGWELKSDYPVKFRRTNSMKALPIPEKGGSLSELDKFLNIHGNNLILVKAWLIACLKPNMPYPLLVLQGEQGSAKSTASEILCELVDPNGNNLRTAPKDERDLAITTTNRLILCLDNLSGIRTWLSDALCRISTGGGFSTRKLHTNNEEMLFTLNNPILLNGIDEIATRGDLLDRSIIVNLPTITARQPKQEFWDDFLSARPKILGALLDVFCDALGKVDGVKLFNYPRMADFAKLGTAAENALELEADRFVEIYAKNRNDANNLALEFSLIAPVIMSLVKEESEWVGIAKDIKDKLDEITDWTIQKNNQFYPKAPIKVANDLRRIAPNLREIGIDVTFDADNEKREAGTGKRLIRIKRLDNYVSQSSQLSQNENENQNIFRF